MKEKKYFWHLSAVTSSEQFTVGGHKTGCRHEGSERWFSSAQQATPFTVEGGGNSAAQVVITVSTGAGIHCKDKSNF